VAASTLFFEFSSLLTRSSLFEHRIFSDRKKIMIEPLDIRPKAFCCGRPIFMPQEEAAKGDRS
jgi:hypothetical protein